MNNIIELKKIGKYNLEITRDKQKFLISTKDINFYFNLIDYQQTGLIKKIIILNKKTKERKYLGNTAFSIEKFLDLINDTISNQIKLRIEEKQDRQKLLSELTLKLEQCCETYNYRFHYEVDNFIIITNYSRWKFNLVDYISTKKINLYHENSRFNGQAGKNNFHKQEVKIISIENIFYYIKKHDERYLDSKKYFGKK